MAKQDQSKSIDNLYGSKDHYLHKPGTTFLKEVVPEVEESSEVSVYVHEDIYSATSRIILLDSKEELYEAEGDRLRKVIGELAFAVLKNLGFKILNCYELSMILEISIGEYLYSIDCRSFTVRANKIGYAQNICLFQPTSKQLAYWKEYQRWFNVYRVIQEHQKSQ